MQLGFLIDITKKNPFGICQYISTILAVFISAGNTVAENMSACCLLEKQEKNKTNEKKLGFTARE